MNIRYPFNPLTAGAALLLVLSACSQDEIADDTRLSEGKYPLVISATNLQGPTSGSSNPSASSRATVDNSWDGNETIALQVDGDEKIYVYTIDANGTMSSENPYYWSTDHSSIIVSAWYPFGETMPNVVVKEDQSIRENYVASDFVSAERQSVEFNSPKLKFTHRTACVILKLKAGSGVDDVTGARVSLLGLDTEYDNPATITPYETGENTYNALLAPQTIAANIPFIRVELNDNVHTAQLANEITLNGGFFYTFNISVTDKGLKVEVGSIQDWGDGGSNAETASELDYIFDPQTKTYTVFNLEGLMTWVAAVQEDYSTNCTLGADISLELPDEGQSNWTAIGTVSTPYTGVFEGNTYTISNLTINSTSTHQGFFGCIGADSEVRNLTLENATVSGNQRVGGIAGLVQVNGKISNCVVAESNFSGTNNFTYVGGIVGDNQGVVCACRFSGTVNGISYLGGVAGQTNGTTALTIACSAEGDIVGVPSSYYSSINGGVTGINTSNGSTIACFARCTVSGNAQLGGVAGQAFSGLVKACYYDDTFGGSGIGRTVNATVTDVDKVDGSTISWDDAMGTMNAAIEAWNSENPDNVCSYRFQMGANGIPEIQ